jgi:predicted nuclease of predicted toxin-antitoxin system
MTPRVLANENFPFPAVALLRERGVDVVAVAESMAGASDEEVMALARDEGRVLLTFDRDYGELVFSRGHAPPPSIIYLGQEPMPARRIGELVLELLAEPNGIAGFFVVASQQSIRRRPMPRGA